jgi:hypothetical protein
MHDFRDHIFQNIFFKPEKQLSFVQTQTLKSIRNKGREKGIKISTHLVDAVSDNKTLISYPIDNYSYVIKLIYYLHCMISHSSEKQDQNLGQETHFWESRDRSSQSLVYFYSVNNTMSM